MVALEEGSSSRYRYHDAFTSQGASAGFQRISIKHGGDKCAASENLPSLLACSFTMEICKSLFVSFRLMMLTTVNIFPLPSVPPITMSFGLIDWSLVRYT